MADNEPIIGEDTPEVNEATGTHAGILTKGMKLSYHSGTSTGTYTDLTNLQEVPAIGNSPRNQVDVTTLEDDEEMTIAGIKGKPGDISFKFLYEPTQFSTLCALNSTCSWRVTFTTGKTAIFIGTPSVQHDGGGVGAAQTYTLTIARESSVDFA